MPSCKRQRTFNDLPDSLLVEILRRLPFITAHRSKLVCKRWYSVISEPYFADRFSHDNNLNYLWYVYYLDDDGAEKINPDPDFGSLALTEPLPLDVTGELPLRCLKIRPLASSNDLLLCWDCSNFLVCNPVTRERVRLPELPSLPFDLLTGDCLLSGFTSKRNGEFAMFVVMDPWPDEPSAGCNTKVLCSSTLVWVETVLPCPLNNVSVFRFLGVSIKEVLFWLDRRSGTIIGIDPFNIGGENPWLFIDPPKEYIPEGGYDARYDYYLGMCRGNLRLCQLSRDDLILRVWDLNDAEWLLHCQVSLRNMVTNARILTSIARGERNIRGCHPTDPHVIYTSDVSQPQPVMSFNLCTSEIKTVNLCPTYGDFCYLIPYTLQWQPTRLPVPDNSS